MLRRLLLVAMLASASAFHAPSLLPPSSCLHKYTHSNSVSSSRGLGKAAFTLSPGLKSRAARTAVQPKASDFMLASWVGSSI
eukprot:759067-Hanusia_phi.AAC.1